MVNKQAGDRLRFKGLTPSSLGEGGKRLPHAAGGMRDGAALGATLRQFLREAARCFAVFPHSLAAPFPGCYASGTNTRPREALRGRVNSSFMHRSHTLGTPPPSITWPADKL